MIEPRWSVTSWLNARLWNANVGAARYTTSLAIGAISWAISRSSTISPMGASGLPHFGSCLTVSTWLKGGSPNSIANLFRSVRFACGSCSISGNTIVCPVPSRFFLRSALML